MEDLISNLKARIDGLFVHQDRPAVNCSVDLSHSILSPMDSVETIRSLPSDLSLPDRSGTSFDEMQETPEINVNLLDLFMPLQTNPNHLDSIFS